VRAPLVTALCLASLSASAQTITSRRETTPYPGVRVIEGRTANPTTDFWAAVVSLCTDYVHVSATRAPTALTVTSRWAASAGVQLATNGDFFTSGPRVYGYAIGAGRAWPVRQTGTDSAVAGEWYYRRYGWIGFGPGRVEFSHTEWVKDRAATLGVREGWMPGTVTTAVPSGLTQLVSGFPELITEGRRVTCASPTASSCFTDRSDMRARNPRTAMGITRDRRTFLLVAVDGRSTRSAGMYGTELARLMELLGAWQAFNLDGGGSTTFWQRGQGVLNRPSDGAERAVANHWGIFAGAASGQSRTAGSCVPVVSDAGVGDAGALDVPVVRDVPMVRDVPVVRDVALLDAITQGDVARLDVITPRDGSPDDVPPPRDVTLDALGDHPAGDDVPSDDDVATESPPDFLDAARAEMPAETAPPDDTAAAGCGCRAQPRGTASPLLAAVALLALRRRRIKAR
jgi:MYXO-CTERM domain-containing protein